MGKTLKSTLRLLLRQPIFTCIEVFLRYWKYKVQLANFESVVSSCDACSLFSFFSRCLSIDLSSKSVVDVVCDSSLVME